MAGWQQVGCAPEQPARRTDVPTPGGAAARFGEAAGGALAKRACLVIDRT
jgi:hypothetical protein